MVSIRGPCSLRAPQCRRSWDPWSDEIEEPTSGRPGSWVRRRLSVHLTSRTQKSKIEDVFSVLSFTHILVWSSYCIYRIRAFLAFFFLICLFFLFSKPSRAGAVVDDGGSSSGGGGWGARQPLQSARCWEAASGPAVHNPYRGGEELFTIDEASIDNCWKQDELSIDTFTSFGCRVALIATLYVYVLEQKGRTD